MDWDADTGVMDHMVLKKRLPPALPTQNCMITFPPLVSVDYGAHLLSLLRRSCLLAEKTLLQPSSSKWHLGIPESLWWWEGEKSGHEF